MPFRPLLASSYTGISKRAEKIDAVRRELNLVVNALPTQVHPTERELYLDAILDDLDDRENAPWTTWPQDVQVLALTAVKSLGRNPVGSETLLSKDHFPILLHHSGLPILSTFTKSAKPLPTQSLSSAPARETLKILANLLVLHEEARDIFANAGGGKAVARALAGKGLNHEDVVLGAEAENVERLFLLGRLGFLVTLGRPSAVGAMVDTEDVVESLVNHFNSLPPVTANQSTLSELLKMTNNIIRFYPSSGSSQDLDHWEQCFDSLLYPVLCLFHSIPFIDISPPLSHTIHVLLSIPFISRLLPTWHSVPNPPSPTQSPSTSSPTQSMKNLLTKLGNLSAGQSPRRLSGEALVPPAGSNGRQEASTSSRRSSGGNSPTRSKPVAHPSTHEPTALPARLLKIFDHFFDTYIPFPKKPDDALPQGLAMEESLPPLLLLLTRAASGSEPIRTYLKETLLPSNMNRSPEAGPLESRKGTLGNILRLMGCAGHAQCRNTAGELMWAICKGDATDLCVEIGYGNAAGILFQKGLSGPPPAKVEELPSDESNEQAQSSTIVQVQPASPIVSTHPSRATESISDSTTASSDVRNPITSLRPELASGGDEMTEEEKEREAERLFVLFDRMERNPVISMKSRAAESEGEGEGRKVSMMDLMRDKLAKGEFEDEDERDAELERKGREAQDEVDEREAMRELDEYKRRVGKK